MIGFLIACGIFIIGILIYRYYNTRTTTRTISVLKNKMTSDWAGGTDKPFDLINCPQFKHVDKVILVKCTKWRHRKKIHLWYEIHKEYMDDTDEF